MKIVIDTNILISAAWDEFSYSWQIINEVIKGNLEAWASEAIIRENKLLLKRAVPNKEYQQQLESFFAQLNIILPSRQYKAVKWDPEDNKFIDAAVAAKADFLITNDSHLLELESFKQIAIVTPKEFWLNYQAQSKNYQSQWRDWIKNILTS